MLGVGCWVLGVGCWVLGVRCWVLGVRCWVLGVGCLVFGVGRLGFVLSFRGWCSIATPIGTVDLPFRTPLPPTLYPLPSKNKLSPHCAQSLSCFGLFERPVIERLNASPRSGVFLFILPMRKLFALALIALASTAAFADESWMGLFLQGAKIGYVYSSEIDTTLNKAPVKESKSSTVIDADLMGQSLKMKMDSSTWQDMHGRPILMKFTIVSDGRTQRVDALFTSSNIHVTTVSTAGAKSQKVIELPKDASVVDDALTTLLESKSAIGAARSYYVFEPNKAMLIKTTVTLQGPASTTVNGKEMHGTKIEIDDSDSKTYAYVTAKGDLIKFEGPMGMEMYPETKAEALSDSTAPDSAAADLATASSLKPDKDIPDIEAVKDLKLRITGRDLSALPTDSHQTVTKDGDAWIVDVHPIAFEDTSVLITTAAHTMPEWTKSSFNIPSDSPTFKALSKKLIGESKTVREAAKQVHDYVYTTMKPNAGIGVLRDATEILQTKEGVCRDYAVLTATLLRAGGVPSRLVSGLVYEEGSFFYHAWVEVWDGNSWVGVDSTLPSGKLTAGHIQLAQGNVEEAFTFTFLDKVKVEVLDARRT